MGKNHKLIYKIILFSIIVLAFGIRIYGLENKDIIGDEGAYSFRAEGYLDYLGTSFQTQPIEWFKDADLPFWTKLSFHDAPPLYFLIQNLFFNIFGDSGVTARLSSVVLGAASAWLIYALAKMFAGEIAALLAAFVFAVGNAGVFLGRAALIEPVLLFFVLLNIYAFFRFIRDNRWWWAFGASFGLVILAKYTGIFLIPAYLIYMLLAERKLFGNWKFYAAFLIALVLFNPVIIYNIQLYRAVGHFDLQVSYFLGQDTPEWSGLVGKTQSPFSDILKNLKEIYGLTGLIAAAIGFLAAIFMILKKKIREIWFVFAYILCLTLMLIAIGSATRFVALYAPAFAILIAAGAVLIWEISKNRYVKFILLILPAGFLVQQAYFTYEKNFTEFPDFGIAKLDNFLQKEFKGIASGAIPQTDNKHLNDVINKFSKKDADSAKRLFAVVYNDNIALPTLEWIFYRRFFYHAVPTMYVENFIRSLKEQDFNNFDIYFVQSTENTLLNPFKIEKTAGFQFEENLKNSGKMPVEIIRGDEDREMFRVYKFSLKG
ncbi:MAG: glycosyltransferase family 39 protein [Candidatus Pacebacteria bacterium]|nr:glycosyltransferase family 39 protein [Candidatus Paceibacterota bacterium]